MLSARMTTGRQDLPEQKKNTVLLPFSIFLPKLLLGHCLTFLFNATDFWFEYTGGSLLHVF